MNKESHWQIVEAQITRSLEALPPGWPHRVEHLLNTVAQAAFREGQSYALMSLLTVQDVAEQFGRSAQWVRVLARRAHDRFGIGYQVPGTHAWLFRPEELDSLRMVARLTRGRPPRE